MTIVFADTFFYIALTNPRDEYHSRAIDFTLSFDGEFVTTEWVLFEFANYMADAHNRALFLEIIDELRRDWRVRIVPSSAEQFERGIALYRQRPDKDWSLTDCISFKVMEESSITEALTADQHFRQAGFLTILS